MTCNKSSIWASTKIAQRLTEQSIGVCFQMYNLYHNQSIIHVNEYSSLWLLPVNLRNKDRISSKQPTGIKVPNGSIQMVITNCIGYGKKKSLPEISHTIRTSPNPLNWPWQINELHWIRIYRLIYILVYLMSKD